MTNGWNCLENSGASYVIITAKHHDGFCLCVDILANIKKSAIKHGLKFGIYYSWMEFNRKVDKEYLSKVVVPQLSELIKYEPDIFWFDGDWEFRSGYSQEVIDFCCKYIRSSLPKTEINDRIGHKEERKNPNFLGLSTYRVYSDRHIPSEKPNVPWEHVNTIGYSWGRNKQQKSSDYKSAKELFELYPQVRKMGGRFLINVGPDAEGNICEEEVQVLKEFGKLL